MPAPSLSIPVILATYTEAEIDEQITRLKAEMEDLYSSATSDKKAGERDIKAVRADMEAFGQAKIAKMGGSPGLVQTQATFNGPGAHSNRWDSGSGM